MPAWPHGDPRDVARSIVADPRFTVPSAKPKPQHSWLDDALAWIAGLLRSILHGLDHALGARSPLDTAIGFAVIAAALVLLGYCTVIVVRSYGRPAKRRLEPSVSAALPVAGQSSAALHAAAIVAAEGGRYRDAAGLLFVSAVRALDERGRLTYDPARTAGEYRRIVRDPLFDAFALDAVVALFAAAEPRNDLFERVRGAYDRYFDTLAR